ncbi:hypothetical protein A1QO_04035 [Vibrio genomosp. F10 str. ZF-129]|uniref:Uncharacterized protein n=1 Tax=Vibrio genomosp. F10 str. ZF-129 TaxID=1187848 RepID=A0A1E5BIM2_9VIBR|nr:hypothetical protein [Vibrio genomosp. F10]OEE37281.1 hypothetical protein A1QO_04035 [Vibrio genomosp. F10 str. ZF-129]
MTIMKSLIIAATITIGIFTPVVAVSAAFEYQAKESRVWDKVETLDDVVFYKAVEITHDTCQVLALPNGGGMLRSKKQPITIKRDGKIRLTDCGDSDFRIQFMKATSSVNLVQI